MRDIERMLRPNGQDGDQDAVDVKLSLAGGNRMDMYGCQDINSKCTNIHQGISISRAIHV
jgi:hypothetical protein